MLYRVIPIGKRYQIVVTVPNFTCDGVKELLWKFVNHEILEDKFEMTQDGVSLVLITSCFDSFNFVLHQCKFLLNSGCLRWTQLKEPSVYSLIKCDGDEFRDVFQSGGPESVRHRIMTSNGFDAELSILTITLEEDEKRCRLVMWLGDKNRERVIQQGGFIKFNGGVYPVFDNLGLQMCKSCYRFGHKECMEIDGCVLDVMDRSHASSLLEFHDYESVILKIYQSYGIFTDVLMIPKFVYEI